jgi:cell division protein FtsX
MRNQRTPPKNRSERSGNLVSIEAHDLTSRAYSKDMNQRPQTSFSAYLTVAVLVFLVIFFAGIYELVMETWKQLK